MADTLGLQALFRVLLDHFGPQHWWPAKTLEELCIGAILTQNVAWRNVEQALGRLKERGLLNIQTLAATSVGALAEAIRPAGYHNVKARRLRAFAAYCEARYEGDVAKLLNPTRSPDELREELLNIYGIGPETADCMLVYGAGHPAFIADAYGRRILSRVGLIETGLDYEQARRTIEQSWDPEPSEFGCTSPAQVWGEFHALLVKLGKTCCTKSDPHCMNCPVVQYCNMGREYTS